jgi:hypothetical protein
MTLLESLHKQVSVRLNVLAGYPTSHVMADRTADVIKFTVAAQRRGAMSQAMETQKSETIDSKQACIAIETRSWKTRLELSSLWIGW